MAQTIYLDHAATTPVRSAVWEAMQPYFSEHFGNPSSVYQLGREARQALDNARQRVARVLQASPQEIIFTASGTEGNNLAIKGVAQACSLEGRGKHIITTQIEHHAVLHSCEYLERFGFEVTYLPVDEQGLIHPALLEAAIRPDTVLVSIMLANNEVGTIQPIQELTQIAHDHGAYFHTDAVQAVGALPLDVGSLQVDLLSISAHKFYGPKGAGLLYTRRGVPLLAQMNGGGQERHRRGGTENIAAIVGLTTALCLAEEEREAYVSHCLALRERLIEGILSQTSGAQLNGHRSQRLPNNANFCFKSIDGEALLLKLDRQGICASSGSACTSGDLEPSYVLTAMGIPSEIALGSLRLTVGWENTLEQIDQTIQVLPGMVEQVRAEISNLAKQ
jgi:cysteine desulfurase